MRRERVTTFGQIEEWTPAKLERYRKMGLPKLLDAGAKTICLANHFANNMNTWGIGLSASRDHKVQPSEDNYAPFATKRGGRNHCRCGEYRNSSRIFDNRIGSDEFASRKVRMEELIGEFCAQSIERHRRRSPRT
jgi:hypothetical protein